MSDVNINNIKKEILPESTADRCSICWSEPPVNAVNLHCQHLFCFLCIKTVAKDTRQCALCRTTIDIDFDHDKIQVVGNAKLPSASNDGHYWFYQGRTGWWLYDPDTSAELEDAYQMGHKRVERLISGHVYVINLIKRKQYQKGDRSKSRSIQRCSLDVISPILGIAGIRDDGFIEQLKLNQLVKVDEGLRF